MPWYGYLPKRVKELVDAITDELALQPDVAACYQVWNDLRDELERYYKDKPRIHNPLSKQKEFKAIKNSIIREAEHLRLELEQQEISSASPEQKKESGKDEPTASPEKTDTVQQQYKSQPMNHHNPAVMTTVTRLLYHMGRIFRDNGMAPASPWMIMRNRTGRMVRRCKGKEVLWHSIFISPMSKSNEQPKWIWKNSFAGEEKNSFLLDGISGSTAITV